MKIGRTMKEFLANKKKLIIAIVLCAIIAASLGRIAYLCAYVKEGVHSDEVWSYGLANGYKEPYIYTNYMQNEDKYRNKWITGKTLRDYLTVQEGEGFDYGSVLYNLKSDNHPPMYFFVLHTISSFFPDVYSRWFGYAINFVVFVITMIYLYLLAAKLSRNRLTALLVVALYGFGIGGVNTFIFIRHYAMVAMFMVMTIYYTMKLLEADGKKQYLRRLAGLLAIITMGCLTHYEFVPFLAAYGICLLIYYIKAKKWFEMFTYGGICATCAIILLLATGIFTRLIMRITGTDFDGTDNGGSNDDGQTFIQDVVANVKMSIYDLTGISVSDTVALIVIILIGVIILGVVAFFMIRRRKAKANEEPAVKNEADSIKTFTWIATGISAIAFTCFVSATASQKNMGIYANRYMFPIYPVFALMLVCVIRKIIILMTELLAKRCRALTRANIARTVSVVAITAGLVLGSINCEYIFLFPRNSKNNVHMEDLVKGKNVALYLSETWLLTTYTDLLIDANDIYVADSSSLEQMRTAELGDHEIDYVVFDATSFYYSYSSYYKYNDEDGRRMGVEKDSNCMRRLKLNLNNNDLKGSKELEFVTDDWVFTRRVYVYKVVDAK